MGYLPNAFIFFSFIYICCLDAVRLLEISLNDSRYSHNHFLATQLLKTLLFYLPAETRHVPFLLL